MIYRFGVFEADVESNQLLRRGLRVRIQDQPFRLLVALLEADGGIVAKDTLRDHLWPSDTYVELDTSLSVAVAKLREALGDEASNPRFVETIPRRGYRFLAPIQRAASSPPSLASGDRELREPPQELIPVTMKTSSQDSSDQGASITRRRLYLGAVIVATLLAGVFYYHAVDRRAAAGGVHGIVVSEFVNTTGDPVFSGSLRRALIVDLAQSPTFQIYSDAAIDQALQGLGRPPAQGVISPEIARQACQPLGADVSVIGSIARQDIDHYTVSIEADRCGDGARLGKASEEVIGRDKILPTVGRTLIKLRGDLGEPQSSRTRFNVAIEQATTDSLDALNAYRVGLDLRSRGRQPESIPLFKAAIVLDAKFAKAYEQAGSVYYNVGEQLEGGRYMQRAFDLRDRITEPERLLITGRYFDVVTGQVEKALDVYALWQSIYPLDWLPYNEAANDAKLIGRYEFGIQAARKAIRFEPNHAFGYSNLAIALMGVNRFTEAQAVCDEAIAKGRDGSELHRTIYELAFLSGDSERIRKAAKLMEGDVDVTASAALASASVGRIAEATNLLADNAEKARIAGFPGAAAYPLGLEALLLADVGEREKARRGAHAALAAKGGSTGFGLALVAFAVARDRADAEDAGRQYDQAYPLSIYNMDVYRPAARGALAALNNSSPQEVKDMLAASLPYEFGREAMLIPTYIRSQALLAAGDGADAIIEFKRLLDHRGVNPVSPYLSLAHLGLARGFRLIKNKNASCAEYRKFLELWRNSDPGIPVKLVAQREYASTRCPQSD